MSQMTREDPFYDPFSSTCKKSTRQRNNTRICKGKPLTHIQAQTIRKISVFLSATLKARREWNDPFKALKVNILSSKIAISSKAIFYK